jgi:hypothetical protein
VTTTSSTHHRVAASCGLLFVVLVRCCSATPFRARTIDTHERNERNPTRKKEKKPMLCNLPRCVFVVWSMLMTLLCFVSSLCCLLVFSRCCFSAANSPEMPKQNGGNDDDETQK